MSDALRDLGRVLYSPNAAMLRIRGNPRPYVALSVAVFVLPSVFAAAHTSFQLLDGDSSNWEGDFGGFGHSAPEHIAITSVTNGIAKIVWVVVIYRVGGRLGTKSSFGKIFCTISYAQMPVLVGGLINTGFSFLLGQASLAASADEVAASQIWDLYGIPVESFIMWPFLIWSFVITVKAIKRTNDVGTIRAIGTVAAAIGASIATGVIPGFVTAAALLIP